MSLSNHHTFGFDAHCRQLLNAESDQELVAASKSYPLTYLLGEGSNTVFVDDFAGCIIVNCIKGIRHFERPEYHELIVGAGENWHYLVSECVKNGWHGLENLALIPGTVGAAPIQNIGAYGVEVAQFVHEVIAVDAKTGEKHVFSNADCDFSYRTSFFKQHPDWLITEVIFRLPKNSRLNVKYADIARLAPQSPQSLFDAVVEIRQAKLPDPRQIGNAGSFFKNPVIANEQWHALKRIYPEIAGYASGEHHMKVAAAWLIDKLGFKTKHIGDIHCHSTQPLVLVNKGKGTGTQLISFAKDIISSVNDTFGIKLEPEVRLIGKQGLMKL